MLKPKPLIISILISLGAGALAALLTLNSMEIYKSLVLPPLAPPGIIFPIIWTILFVLMGISAYLIFISTTASKEDRKAALFVYARQLVVNFFWSIIFFNLTAYLLAFVWILLLWYLILIMIIKFQKVNKIAGYLQIPYLVWVTFAAYLTYAIWVLNG